MFGAKIVYQPMSGEGHLFIMKRKKENNSNEHNYIVSLAQNNGQSKSQINFNPTQQIKRPLQTQVSMD